MFFIQFFFEQIFKFCTLTIKNKNINIFACVYVHNVLNASYLMIRFKMCQFPHVFWVPFSFDTVIRERRKMKYGHFPSETDYYQGKEEKTKRLITSNCISALRGFLVKRIHCVFECVWVCLRNFWSIHEYERIFQKCGSERCDFIFWILTETLLLIIFTNRNMQKGMQPIRFTHLIYCYLC